MKEKNEFGRLIDYARNHHKSGLPFVLYRNPKEHTVRGVFQQSTELNEISDFTEEGFVFARFRMESLPILLRPEIKIDAPFNPTASSQNKISLDDSDMELHHKLVSKALAAIRAGQFQKVVLSRRIAARTKKDCFTLFRTMLSRYPMAFCYVWYHPKVGCWLGATPERLLTIEGIKATTISLAGTLTSKDGSDPDWSEKELEEQQLVTDYLVRRFSSRLDDVQASSPVAVKAGSLWHLKSIISGTVSSREYLLKNLIQDIHPTPAVCGVPKENAYDFILENEAHDREFYTGYLGPLNNESGKQTHLYVNLRCLKYENNGVQIYVGGGITNKSLPRNEFKETQYKSQTMLQLL